ncbi:ring-cleaving dioxygenase [Paenibacillus odorifer]|uniref:ring-cleaving dioxygenase n=1 Tax=Paenibacillus odorifer TaxID=189426 RepID=UPI000BA03E3F|nr:ring-cleaving dioxygenase [Paenibacillus odorifer]OZQ71118.1 ring-cleaving dioxygenase [Paenibacillus odorifer]
MSQQQITGQHHVSMITKDAKQNLWFYTKVLGLRLVKKTVNQDDPTMYHLFYGNPNGAPGTEVSFFEMPNAGQTRKGTNSISAISLLVPSDEALVYWANRLDTFEIAHEAIVSIEERNSLTFQDSDELTVHLVSAEKDNVTQLVEPWITDDIPPQYAIVGLGPVELTVREASRTKAVLEDILGYTQVRRVPSMGDPKVTVDIYETAKGGLYTELQLKEVNDQDRERPGKGSIHHVAIRVKDLEELSAWAAKITAAGFKNTGVIDRYYFHSLYFRDPNHILFELATDGPGFEIDESFDALGENLTLPSFLEERREEIESKLHPIQ